MSVSSTKELAFYQGMLLYFNQTLLERKVINEEEYRAIKLKIQTSMKNTKAAGLKCTVVVKQ